MMEAEEPHTIAVHSWAAREAADAVPLESKAEDQEGRGSESQSRAGGVTAQGSGKRAISLLPFSSVQASWVGGRHPHGPSCLTHFRIQTLIPLATPSGHSWK